MRNTVREVGKWIIDFECRVAVTQIDSDMWNVVSDRVADDEKQVVTFNHLPLVIQKYIQDKYPNTGK